MVHCAKVMGMLNYCLNTGGNMNLLEYLFYSRMTVKDFAKIADLSNAFLSRVINGKVTPSPKTLRVIERVTNGRVKTTTAFLPIRFPDEQEDEDGKAA
jgi:transcriptional regulator with XRE-family HTH domain